MAPLRLRYFFLLLLLSLYTLQTSHAAVQFAVTYNAGTSGGGTRYTNQIGDSYTLQTQESATSFIWRLFQQDNEADRKAVPKVTLFIDNFNGVPAYSGNNEIHVNANYLGDYNGDVKAEFTGVFVEKIIAVVREVILAHRSVLTEHTALCCGYAVGILGTTVDFRQAVAMNRRDIMEEKKPEIIKRRKELDDALFYRAGDCEK